MAKRVSQTANIQAEVIKALLANGPVIMEIAREMQLSTREVRNILYETLMNIDGIDPLASDAIPVMAQTPSEVTNLISNGIEMLRGNKFDR